VTLGSRSEWLVVKSIAIILDDFPNVDVPDDVAGFWIQADWTARRVNFDAEHSIAQCFPAWYCAAKLVECPCAPT
jgi:hypothetical protein